MKPHSRKLLGLTKNDEGYLSNRNNTSNTTAVSESTTLETSDDTTTIEETTGTPTTKDGLRSPTLGFDTSMALTVLVLLTALFFMVFFSMYLRRFASDDQDSLEISARARRRRQLHRRSNNNNSSSRLSNSTSASNSLSVRSNRQTGLDSLTVKSLPLFAYEHGNSSTKGEAQEESIDCVVCLSEFEERETVKMIPYCGHVFHPECIDTWFSSQLSCPLCRSTKLFSSTSTAKNKNHDDNIITIDKQLHDNHHHHQVMEDATERSVIRNDDTCVVAARGLEGSSHITRNSSWPNMQIEKDSAATLTRCSSF